MSDERDDVPVSVQLRLERCPTCGELNLTFLRTPPDAVVVARWQFRKNDGTTTRTPGCDHFVIDGLEIRSVAENA